MSNCPAVGRPIRNDAKSCPMTTVVELLLDARTHPLPNVYDPAEFPVMYAFSRYWRMSSPNFKVWFPMTLVTCAEELVGLRRIPRCAVVAQALEAGLAAATAELDVGHQRILGIRGDVGRVTQRGGIESLARLVVHFVHAREVDAHVGTVVGLSV